MPDQPCDQHYAVLEPGVHALPQKRYLHARGISD